MESVVGAALLLLMQCRWWLLIFPQVRAVTGKMTGSAAVVIDYYTLWLLLVINGGAWWYGSKIGGVMAWLVLPP